MFSKRKNVAKPNGTRQDEDPFGELLGSIIDGVVLELFVRTIFDTGDLHIGTCLERDHLIVQQREGDGYMLLVNSEMLDDFIATILPFHYTWLGVSDKIETYAKSLEPLEALLSMRYEDVAVFAEAIAAKNREIDDEAVLFAAQLGVASETLTKAVRAFVARHADRVELTLDTEGNEHEGYVSVPAERVSG